MEINFSVQPVNRPVPALARQTDVSSGFDRLGQGLHQASAGYQKYLNSADKNESDLTAMQIANQSQLDLDAAYSEVTGKYTDPQLIAKYKNEAFRKVRDRAYERANHAGVSQTFQSLVNKQMYNEQANILKEAHETEGVYAQSQLIDAVDGYKKIVQETVQGSMVSQDMQSGALVVDLGIDGQRDLSAKHQGLRLSIQRALQSVPPEKVLETLNGVNKGLEDSYAKSLIGSLPDGPITSTILNNTIVVPRFQLVDGQVVPVPHELSQEEKVDLHTRVIAGITGVQSQLANEKAQLEAVKEQEYHVIRADMDRMYGTLGKDTDLRTLRGYVDGKRSVLTNKRYADLQADLNKMDNAIQASLKAHTDQDVFMGLLARIESFDEVSHTELREAAMRGELNKEDFQFLRTQKSTFDGQVKTEFDNQFKTTLKQVDGLFSSSGAVTILGDKVSKYNLFVNQEALRLRGGLTQEEKADSLQANRIVLEAAANILPGFLSTQLDSSSGIHKSQFGKFFEVMAGGDLETARHMLATTPGLSTVERTNIEFGIKGMEAIQQLQRQVQSGKKTSFSLQRDPEAAINPRSVVEPIVPEAKTRVPQAQGKVNQIETHRQTTLDQINKTIEARRKKLDEIRKLQQQKEQSHGNE